MQSLNESNAGTNDTIVRATNTEKFFCKRFKQSLSGKMGLFKYSSSVFGSKNDAIGMKDNYLLSSKTCEIRNLLSGRKYLAIGLSCLLRRRSGTSVQVVSTLMPNDNFFVKIISSQLKRETFKPIYILSVRNSLMSLRSSIFSYGRVFFFFF